MHRMPFGQLMQRNTSKIYGRPFLQQCDRPFGQGDLLHPCACCMYTQDDVVR